MLELLTDDESQPLPIFSPPNPLLWDEFSLPAASESDLIRLLQHSSLQKFESLDSDLSQITSIHVFNSDTLDYISEIFYPCKRYIRELSDSLAIRTAGGLAILSVMETTQTINMVYAGPFTELGGEDHTAITNIVNALLHWLWLHINSY
jgi:hypothetical protein